MSVESYTSKLAAWDAAGGPKTPLEQTAYNILKAQAAAEQKQYDINAAQQSQTIGNTIASFGVYVVDTASRVAPGGAGIVYDSINGKAFISDAGAAAAGAADTVVKTGADAVDNTTAAIRDTVNAGFQTTQNTIKDTVDDAFDKVTETMDGAMNKAAAVLLAIVFMVLVAAVFLFRRK
jgi:hypothetical protein